MQTNNTKAATAPERLLLGICQAVGDDLGFNALWLRLVLSAALFWSPVGAVAAYAFLGVAVLVSRRLYPDPRRIGSRRQPAAA